MISRVTAFVVCMTCALAAPPGDRFEDPIRLAGESALHLVDLRDATAEPGEASHYRDMGVDGRPFDVPPRSVWVSWRAPREGVAQVILARRDPLTPSLSQPRVPGNPHVALYTNGTRLASLAPVSGERFSRLGHELTRFPVVSGCEYRLAISATQPWMAEYWLAIRLDATAIPENDSLTNALPWETGSAAILFDLDLASSEPEEPDFGTTEFVLSNDRFIEWVSPVSRGGSSLWFRWVPPADGPYAFHVSAPAAYPQLALYRRKREAATMEAPRFSQLDRVGRASNGGFWISASSYQPCEGCTVEWSYWEVPYRAADATVAVSARAGEELWIQVDRLWGDSTYWTVVDPGDGPGAGVLNRDGTHRSAGVLHVTAAAPNDAFSQALELPDPGRDLEPSYYQGASWEEGEQEPGGPDGNPGSVWWKWSAPATGAFLAVGPPSDAYRGSTLAGLQRLTGDSSASRSSYFEATAGESVLLRCQVLPADDEQQPAVFPTIFPTPANDRFESARPLDLTVERRFLQPPGPLLWEPGEPRNDALTNSGSAWFGITSERDQMVRLSYDGFQGREVTSAMQVGFQMTLFEGDTLSNLRPLPPAVPGFVQQEFFLRAGTRYHLQIQEGRARWSYPRTYYWTVAPSHDLFAGRSFLGSAYQSYGLLADSDWFTLQSAEAGEPPHGGVPAARSLWYEWEVPQSGPHVLRFVGRRGSRVALYRGGSLDSLQRLADLALLSDGEVMGRFAAEKGERLVFAFEDSSPAWFGHMVQLQPALEHDDPNTPAPMDDLRGFSTWPATVDTREHSLVPEASHGVLWHQWTAPEDGLWSLEIIWLVVEQNPSPTPQLRIFTANSADALIPLETSTPPVAPGRELLLFHARSGQSYRIAVLPRVSHLLQYRLGMTGPTVTGTVAVSIQPDSSGQGWIVVSRNRFLHRMERSEDLRHWENLGWFETPADGIYHPKTNLMTQGANTFIRVVRP